MHIASVGSVPANVVMPKVPEAAEGPGPDHDGDSDDKGAVRSATAAGVGQAVDVTA